MGMVTGIVASPRREGRFELLVDGATFATVSLDLVERFGLRVGLALDDAGEAALRDAAGTLATYDRALGMLAANARSARDLRRRLVLKGEPEAHVAAAIERLVAAGYLDDADYARQFARSRLLGAGTSKRRLKQELFRKGVAGAVVDEAVAEVVDEEGVDEEATAERAARKRLRALGSMDPETRRRRLYAFLARRGFESDAIRRVMARVLTPDEMAALDGDADAGASDDDA
jgi:regulatory protein